MENIQNAMSVVPQGCKTKRVGSTSSARIQVIIRRLPTANTREGRCGIRGEQSGTGTGLPSRISRAVVIQSTLHIRTPAYPGRGTEAVTYTHSFNQSQ